MPSCDGKMITAADIARSEMDIKKAFAEIQAQGHLPKDFNLHITPDPLTAASIQTGPKVVNASSAGLSCINGKETKAVLLHEAGHYQYPPPFTEAVLFNIQCVSISAALTLLLWQTATSLFQAVSSKKRRIAAPFSWKEVAATLGACFLIHSVNGKLLAENGKNQELKADAYAAQTMGTPEYMVSSLKKLDSYNPFSSSSTPSEAATPSKTDLVKALAIKHLLYGPWGMFNTHPSVQERIDALAHNKIKLPPKTQRHGPS